jgi:hypothetical protein
MGECYVHGRMQGEGVKLCEEKDILIFQEL